MLPTSSFAERLMVILLSPINPLLGALMLNEGGVSSTRNWNRLFVETSAESIAVTVIVLLPVKPAHDEPWNGFIAVLFVNPPPVELQLDVKLMFLRITLEATSAEKLIPVDEVIVD